MCLKARGGQQNGGQGLSPMHSLAID